MDPVERPDFIVIARIVRTRGNRGEVLADLHTDFPARFDQLKEVWLEFEGKRRERFALEGSWEHKGRRVLKFKGVDSISAAEILRGAWVEVAAVDAVRLPEGSYFDHDLIGCTLYDLQGNVLGSLRDILHVAGNDLLVAESARNGREFLVPAVTGICKEICVQEKRIVLELPEGLMDLNK